ncbi:MAG TPA: hypothetical protein VN457_03420 [Chlamydiales bacterium]|nr:hypothetical protein [Chlamydiales bacterium]
MSKVISAISETAQVFDQELMTIESDLRNAYVQFTPVQATQPLQQRVATLQQSILALNNSDALTEGQTHIVLTTLSKLYNIRVLQPIADTSNGFLRPDTIRELVRDYRCDCWIEKRPKEKSGKKDATVEMNSLPAPANSIAATAPARAIQSAKPAGPLHIAPVDTLIAIKGSIRAIKSAVCLKDLQQAQVGDWILRYSSSACGATREKPMLVMSYLNNTGDALENVAVRDDELFMMWKEWCTKEKLSRPRTA